MTSTIIVYSLLATFTLLGGLVSLSLKPQIRGFRNLTMLACYILGVVSFFVVNIYLAIAVWVGLGILSGLAYIAHEAWTAHRHPDPKGSSGIQISNLFYGPIAWPLMIIEVFEYTWAEVFPIRKKE